MEHEKDDGEWACFVQGEPCKYGFYRYDNEGKIVAWVCTNLDCHCHETWEP